MIVEVYILYSQFKILLYLGGRSRTPIFFNSDYSSSTGLIIKQWLTNCSSVPCLASTLFVVVVTLFLRFTFVAAAGYSVACPLQSTVPGTNDASLPCSPTHSHCESRVNCPTSTIYQLPLSDQYSTPTTYCSAMKVIQVPVICCCLLGSGACLGAANGWRSQQSWRENPSYLSYSVLVGRHWCGTFNCFGIGSGYGCGFRADLKSTRLN